MRQNQRIMKKKRTAAILALFFGVFGMHRYYLGKRGQGILHTFLFFICLFANKEGPNDGLLMAIPSILGFMDSVLLWVMPQLEFDEKYNARYLDYEPAHEVQEGKFSDLFKSEAIRKFRQSDFTGAVSAFGKSLEKFGESPEVHFSLACCYSMTRDADMAFFHLEKAVANGMPDTGKIHNNATLDYVRADSRFRDFAAAGFRMISQPENPIQPVVKEEEDLYGQILRLGDLKEKGLINEEDFKLRKKKILDTPLSS